MDWALRTTLPHPCPPGQGIVYAPAVSSSLPGGRGGSGGGPDPSGDGPHRLIVIDGPAGAGKSTVARRVASHFGLPYLDTGAIYRTLALRSQRAGVSWDDDAGLTDQARAMDVRFVGGVGGQRVMCDGEDVSEAIRTPEISDGASRVSVHPGVRDALLDIQRAQGARGCVAEGRDMGTVVFPHAPHKFFLTADLETRARRRHEELVRRGIAGTSLEQVVEEMRERDARDASRPTAPLSEAADAQRVDSSGMDVDQVVAAVIAAVGA